MRGCTSQGAGLHREVHHCLLQVYHAAILGDAVDQGAEQEKEHWLWEPGGTQHMPQTFSEVLCDPREQMLVGTVMEHQTLLL